MMNPDTFIRERVFNDALGDVDSEDGGMMQDLCQTTCLDVLELWLASRRVNDAMVGMKRKSEKTSSTTMRNPETTTYQCTMIVLNHVPPKKNFAFEHVINALHLIISQLGLEGLCHPMSELVEVL